MSCKGICYAINNKKRVAYKSIPLRMYQKYKVSCC